MKNIIDLLGKTVKFVHTENERFFEEQGQITEIVWSLSGEHQISINNNDFYILKNLLEFEIVWKPLFSSVGWDFVNIPRPHFFYFNISALVTFTERQTPKY